MWSAWIQTQTGLEGNWSEWSQIQTQALPTSATLWVNKEGDWDNPTTVYVNVGGEWKQATVYIKQEGVWLTAHE